MDLPGYGYAKAPEEIRSQWEGLLGPYLQGREALAGLVLIMDSRHPLTELDQDLLDWFAVTGKPIHILLSKADKLTRQEQAVVLREVKAALANLSDRCTVQLFSSLKKNRRGRGGSGIGGLARHGGASGQAGAGAPPHSLGQERRRCQEEPYPCPRQQNGRGGG